MDVTQARGRTFEHLFLLGLNRGEFPRTVREDPVFPDTLRRLLGREGYGVLPDLPVKRSGFDEERFLFAQLLASAPRVTLSWQEADNDNKVRTPSPLVERLRWSERGQQLDRWSRAPPPAAPVLASHRGRGSRWTPWIFDPPSRARCWWLSTALARSWHR